MDLKEYLSNQISYFETMEKVWTHEVIDTLRAVIKELYPEPKKIEAPTDEIEIKALQYLKDIKVRGAHFYKGDKLIAKAIEEGFIF